MTATLGSFPVFRALDANGAPLVGGFLHSYAAGSLTPLATYTDQGGGTQNTNPVELDSTGSANVWFGSSAYKLVLKTSTGSTLWTVDNYQPDAGSIQLRSDLASTASAAVGDALIGVKSALTGGTARTQHGKNADYLHVKDFGAVVDGIQAGTGTDDTAAIQAALNAAYAAKIGTVHIGDGISIINGTLTIPAGVALVGGGSTNDYYPANILGAIAANMLLKPTTGTTGPIAIMQTGSILRGMTLRTDLYGGHTRGIVQMGLYGNYSIYEASLDDVRLYGSAKAADVYGAANHDVTGATTCYGIYFPDGNALVGPYQRYMNRFNGVRIVNCDVGIHLGDNCNGNNFSNITTRQCVHHIELNGTTNNASSGCVDNVFTGLSLINMGVYEESAGVPLAELYCFVLKNACTHNSFTGYSTEANGRAFSIDDTCQYNGFTGRENEAYTSIVPVISAAGVKLYNQHSLWAAPVNVNRQTQMILQDQYTTTSDSYRVGYGSKLSFFSQVSGTLPQLNGTVITAADVSSKRIVLLGKTAFAKTVQTNFYGDLLVTMSPAGGGVGPHIVRVRFLYRMTNNTTSAGVLSVLQVEKNPAASNYISALAFLTGITSTNGFGIAVTGGNYGPFVARDIAVSLDIMAISPSASNLAFTAYSNPSFVSTALTANDVTDAISLLTVADTVV